MSKSFHVNLSFSGLVVLEKKIFQSCNYLFFDVDLVLYMNKFEFPSPRGALHLGWLKLAWWFWKKKNFKHVQCIFTLLQLSALGEGGCISFVQF
jgi:hypothetical protein